MEKMRQALEQCVNENLYQIMISNSIDKDKMTKVKIRPIMSKEGIAFQFNSFVGKQVFHKNLNAEETIVEVCSLMEHTFKQLEIEHKEYQVTTLISKKGKATVKMKAKQSDKAIDLSHNRTKKYILEEGKPVPFLIDLGVQSKEGIIIKSKYDKFKQINRFLEFIDDIVEYLPKDRKVNIVDFGCGKSYLTFAMYYFLTVLKGLDVHIIGLDLKEDVIDHCNQLAMGYGYKDIVFLKGNISDYTGSDEIDMMVTLHACDTATDFALEKAISWNAKVILSVPCCQHEVNKQIENEMLASVLKYGLIKERMSALLTDAIRGNILEEQGYQVQMLEFIDIEHTPKNILIRAIKHGKCKDTGVQNMTESLHVYTTLQKVLETREECEDLL